MAKETPKTIGHDDCGNQNCRKPVAVKKNKDGRPYYNCDHCGFYGEHKWRDTANVVLQKYSPPAADKPAPENPDNPDAAPAKSVLKTLLG